MDTTLLAGIVAGALVSFTAPGTSDAQCLRVWSVSENPALAWLTVVADPRRVLHVALADLKQGCAGARY